MDLKRKSTQDTILEDGIWTLKKSWEGYWIERWGNRFAEENHERLCGIGTKKIKNAE